MAPPVLPDEHARLQRLAATGVLDTAPEAAFTNLTRLAASICQVPIALVSFVDERRQWFKARVGLTQRETPREHSLCAHALGGSEPLVVADALADERFRDNPLVLGEPGIRFYAGIPLRTAEGSALGTLCVIDRVPRQLTPGQLEAMQALAKQAELELKLRVQAPGVLPPPRQEFGEADTQPDAGGFVRRLVSVDREVPVSVGVRLEQRYLIERMLGRGGMGYVFAARDLAAGKRVAIKFLRRDVMNPEEAIGRFVREARVLMQLESEHVVRVHDVGNLGDVPFIVMELVEGEDLGAALARRGPLPVGEAVRFVMQACDVLAEAHDRGIVHRDLKSGNLLVTGGPRGPVVKVLDFGIAKLALTGLPDPGGYVTTMTRVMGTPFYMSPEQLAGDDVVDPRADLWSLGVVLFELLTGDVPFKRASLAETFTAALVAPCPDVRQARPDVPEGVARAIAWCLEKRRDQRPPSAWHLAGALAAFRD